MTELEAKIAEAEKELDRAAADLNKAMDHAYSLVGRNPSQAEIEAAKRAINDNWNTTKEALKLVKALYQRAARYGV